MFNLTDYEKEIRTGATLSKVAPEESLNRFIYNLIVMKDHFKEFSEDIDFRSLGQEWNKLSSDTRNSQRRTCCASLKRAARGL